MVNCTLVGLAISSLYSSSPFLMAPLKNQITSNLIISNFHFSNYFSNFYYSSSLNNQKSYTKFENGQFSYFLNRVIYSTKINQNKENIKLDKIFSERDTFTEISDKKLTLANFIIISNCQFNQIYSKNLDGGCIYTETNLVVAESTFFDCIGTEAGCIYCNNSHLALFSTNSEKCTATKMAGCFVQFLTEGEKDVPTVVSFVNFIDLVSNNLFGISYIESTNAINFKNSNATNCGAAHCVGSFEISKGPITIKMCHFFHSYAKVHNGCLVLRENKDLLIDYTIFSNCEHGTNLQETGCDILIYNVPANALISNTIFKESKYSGGHSISIVNGIELSFENCLFSYTKNVEINPGNSYLCVFYKTIFECTRISYNEKLSTNEVCSKVKSKIESKFSNFKSDLIQKNLNKNKFNDMYLNILFTSEPRKSFSVNDSPENSSNFLSQLFSNIANNGLLVGLGIKKKYVVFFFIYLFLLLCGLVLVVAFELVIRRFPSLCVIKPNKGGIIQAKTPHAIL